MATGNHRPAVFENAKQLVMQSLPGRHTDHGQHRGRGGQPLAVGDRCVFPGSDLPANLKQVSFATSVQKMSTFNSKELS